jgi:hypothetical protein
MDGIGGEMRKAKIEVNIEEFNLLRYALAELAEREVLKPFELEFYNRIRVEFHEFTDKIMRNKRE